MTSEKTIWTGRNSMLSSFFRRLFGTEHYRLTSLRLHKIKVNYFRESSIPEIVELIEINRVEYFENPIFKFVGISIGRIHIETPYRNMIWYSVMNCRRVAELIRSAAKNIANNP